MNCYFQENERLGEKSQKLVSQLILDVGFLVLNQTPDLLSSSDETHFNYASYFLEKLLQIKGIVWGTPLLQVTIFIFFLK